ncbi:hypothetical protein SAMN05192544_1004177 [Paraburkholderia hospita]|nr:hypothetical protein SAMN05192544_1004177 [Paraburkholderia hospita]
MCSATAYTQFATWAAVEHLARHAVSRVREAGEAYCKSAGNGRGTSRLPCEVRDRLGALRQGEEFAVLAAFFCLLFFAAAKKSRCRPAQGRRLKHEGKTRMPAQRQKNQTGRATKTKRGCQRKGQNNQTARAAKPLHRSHRNSIHPNSVADKKTKRLNNTSPRHRHTWPPAAPEKTPHNS